MVKSCALVIKQCGCLDASRAASRSIDQSVVARSSTLRSHRKCCVASLARLLMVTDADTLSWAFQVQRLPLSNVQFEMRHMMPVAGGSISWMKDLLPESELV